MNARRWIGLLCLIAAFFVQPPLARSASEVQPAMRKMALEIEALKPYLLSEEKFLAKENEVEIATRMGNLRKQIEKASHHYTLSRADYRDTVELLLEHLDETKRTFNQGHKELARYMLQGTVETCIACHSRQPGSEKFFVQKPPKAATIPEAEFLFATRHFTEALNAFEGFVAKYPKNGLQIPRVLDALDYIATIYTRVKQEPKAARKSFTKILKRGNLPEFVDEDIQTWIEEFTAWEKEKPFVMETATDQEILDRAEGLLGKNLADPFYMKDRAAQISYLRASSLLHEFLVQRSTSPMVQRAYYLLGVCYVKLKKNFFIGLDQMYLKACMRKTPKTAIARKCYTLLEKSLYLGYSGSSGTHVPYDVMQELGEFKKKYVE